MLFLFSYINYINCIKCCKNSPTDGKHSTSNNICRPDRKEVCVPAYEQMSTEGDSKLTAWRHHWSALQTSPVVSRLAILIHIQEVKRFQMGFIFFLPPHLFFFLPFSYLCKCDCGPHTCSLPLVVNKSFVSFCSLMGTQGDSINLFIRALQKQQKNTY